MTVTLRPAYLAVAGAFLAGVLLVAGIALALSGDDDSQPPITAQGDEPPTATSTSLPPTATSTIAPTAQPTSPPPTATPQPTSTSVPSTGQIAPQPTSNPAPVSTPAPPGPGSGYEFIGVVWADDFMPVPYCVNANDPPIDSNGAPLMSAEAFAATVRQAFQTWQDVSGSYVSFVYQGLCDNDPFDTRDQVNTVGWGWLFSSAVGIAAPSATHGEFLRQSSFGQIYELDIVIDVRYAQSFDNEADYINRALPWVLLHEIGHFIGLDHTDNPCSIMQPVIVDATPGLCEVDRNGARALYPEQ